jgi:hypothetical protein
MPLTSGPYIPGKKSQGFTALLIKSNHFLYFLQKHIFEINPKAFTFYILTYLFKKGIVGETKPEVLGTQRG